MSSRRSRLRFVITDKPVIVQIAWMSLGLRAMVRQNPITRTTHHSDASGRDRGAMRVHGWGKDLQAPRGGQGAYASSRRRSPRGSGDLLVCEHFYCFRVYLGHRPSRSFEFTPHTSQMSTTVLQHSGQESEQELLMTDFSSLVVIGACMLVNEL